MSRFAAIGCALLLISGFLAAQPTPKESPPARDIVAARVNGQPIQELAVYRGLMRLPPQRREAARKEVLNFLIDNTLIDQYLSQLKLVVETKEIDEYLEKVKKEAAAEKQDFKQFLESLVVTEAELRVEIANSLRWDKFILVQGTDEKLQVYFKANPEMFNGSRVQARHILIAGAPDAPAKAAQLRKGIEGEVALAVSKLPANTDAITREKERAKVLEQVFSKAAVDHSTCPSKKDGGDLGYFPRAGAMVEPFARAAFALKPFQMSDPVTTEFGCHLILAVDYKPGKEVKFEEVKPFVQEVFSERLREAVLVKYKPVSKIEILELKK